MSIYDPGMLKLYYAPGTCALATHLALEFANAPYEAIRVDFSKQEQRSPEYLRLNPKGRVPVLVTEQGVLTETPALLQYVAQSFPGANLAPLDSPFEMARVNAFNSYLCATVHVAHAHRVRGYRWADEESALQAMKLKVAQNMAECFALIEDRMLQGPWVLGETFSICDPYLFTLAGWLAGDGVDIQRFPKVAAHSARLAQQPAAAKVLAQHKPG